MLLPGVTICFSQVALPVVSFPRSHTVPCFVHESSPKLQEARHATFLVLVLLQAVLHLPVCTHRSGRVVVTMARGVCGRCEAGTLLITRASPHGRRFLGSRMRWQDLSALRAGAYMVTLAHCRFGGQFGVQLGGNSNSLTRPADGRDLPLGRVLS